MQWKIRFEGTFLCVGIFLIALNVNAQNEEPIPDSRFSIQANIGYTSYNLSDVKDFYEEILTVYTGSGIPIPTQKEYEPNLVMGLAALYKIPKIIDFGLGSQYSKASALSSYEDYAGSLKVKSNISFTSLEGIIQHAFPSKSNYNFFTSIRGGMAFIHSSYTHTIIFNDFPDQNGEINLTGSGTGYIAEGLIGIQRSFMKFDVMITGGYRQTSVSKLDATLKATDQSTINDTMEIKHDLSGWILSAVIAYKF